MAVCFADVVHAADVRMRDLPRRPRFVVELRQPLRILFQAGRQEFQRDGLTETEVVSPVDLSHAAAAEQAENTVALLKDLARLKPAVVDRPRRAEPATRRCGLPGTEPGLVTPVRADACRIVGHGRSEYRSGGRPQGRT